LHITSIHPVEYKGFIRFQIRSSKDDASEYATYCPKSHGYQKQAERVEKDIWLGKVLDRENGIFCNKERGIFKFTTEDGFSSLPDTEVAMFRDVLNSKKSKNQSRPRNLDNSNVSIDFGDIFILHEYFSDCGLFNIFHNAYPENTDTLDSLIVYRLLKSSSNRFAFNWWNESYVKYLYPKAQLSSQQISNFLSDLGNETNYRRYIIEHINYVKG
jgi:hypothetical protein